MTCSKSPAITSAVQALQVAVFQHRGRWCSVHCIGGMGILGLALTTLDLAPKYVGQYIGSVLQCFPGTFAVLHGQEEWRSPPAWSLLEKTQRVGIRNLHPASRDLQGDIVGCTAPFPV